MSFELVWLCWFHNLEKIGKMGKNGVDMSPIICILASHSCVKRLCSKWGDFFTKLLAVMAAGLFFKGDVV